MFQVYKLESQESRLQISSCILQECGKWCSGLDHSRLVCGSGVAFTCTTKVDTKPGASDSDIFDEDAPILP